MLQCRKDEKTIFLKSHEVGGVGLWSFLVAFLRRGVCPAIIINNNNNKYKFIIDAYLG